MVPVKMRFAVALKAGEGMIALSRRASIIATTRVHASMGCANVSPGSKAPSVTSFHARKVAASKEFAPRAQVNARVTQLGRVLPVIFPIARELSTALGMDFVKLGANACVTNTGMGKIAA